MYVIEVIPLLKGTQLTSLSYFSSVSYPLGTILSVPIRNSEQSAIVVKAEPVSKAKTAVRAATFSLKKLPPQTPSSHLSESLMRTVSYLEKRLPAERGAILYTLLTPEIRTGEWDIHTAASYADTQVPAEVSVMQAPRADRYIYYRSRIREEFAHRGSVLFVVPTQADMDYAYEALSGGITDRVVMLSAQYGKTKQKKAYTVHQDFSTAKLIITTPTYAYLERPDLTTIIIDHARSPHFVGRQRPYLDHRVALHGYANAIGAQILKGDLLPLSEDEYWRREDIYQTATESPRRLTFSSNVDIISKRKTDATPFHLLYPKTKSIIAAALAERQHIFVHAARRGLAPLIMCNDCGFIFRCPDSGAPYSLMRTQYQGEEVRWFISTTSGRRIRAVDTCTECGSWRLREQGIGVQQVYDALLREFPDAPVVLFDHTTATTKRKVQQLLAAHYDTKGSILLGTNMVLPYLTAQNHISIVTSLDAARTMPTWRADEELLAFLLLLRERTDSSVYLQSRYEEDSITTIAKQGTVARYYDEELSSRQQLNYPPFTTLIKISWSGTKAAALEIDEQLNRHLPDYALFFYNTPQSTTAKTIRAALIRIPQSAWPQPALMDALRKLPPAFKIEVNPHSLL